MSLATLETSIAPLEIAKIATSTLIKAISPLVVSISSFAMTISTLQ